MKRFSELGINPQDERKIYDCSKVSITDVLNIEIEVIDFLPNVKTSQGEGRYLVHFREVATQREGKFFTNAKKMKSVLSQVKLEDLPFVTVIKATKCGEGKIYHFT